MRSSPAVSVITAAYNSARTLRVALSSLIAQTFADWEAWIVGDGSTDDSASVTRSFGDSRLHWINLERNHGSQAFPNNEGLRRARGVYIAFLGHDDIWLPDHLSVLTRYIEDSGADLVHSVCGNFGPDRIIDCWGPPADTSRYDRHFVPPSSWLHRRSLIESVGFWSDPNDLAVGVDFHYLRRVHRARKKIACCPEFTVIKIVSDRIRLYSLTGETPQERYWHRVQADLPGFRRELLGAIGAELAKHSDGRFGPPSCSFMRMSKLALHTAKRNFRELSEQWPLLSSYWRARYQAARRAARTRRGLPAKSGR